MAQRRYQIRVQDTGAQSALIQVGNEPNCLGWELSFSVARDLNMVIASRVVLQDDWEGGGAGILVGPFFTTAGGKLFIPFPSFSLQAADLIGLNVGNTATVRMVARPVLSDGWSAASSTAIGAETVQIAPAGTNTFNLPALAIGYKMTCSNFGPPPALMQVDLSNSFGIPLSYWAILSGSTSSFDDGGQAWRETGDPGSTVVVSNGGAGPAAVTIWHRFDFRRLK